MASTRLLRWSTNMSFTGLNCQDGHTGKPSFRTGKNRFCCKLHLIDVSLLVMERNRWLNLPGPWNINEKHQQLGKDPTTSLPPVAD